MRVVAENPDVRSTMRQAFFGWWVRPSRRSVAVAWGLALLLAAGPWWAGWLDRSQAALHDAQARVFAPRAAASGVLLVDIDETSVQSLRADHGGWPPSRALLATVTAHLLDAGARVVVIDLVLADPREGDASLAEVITSHPGRVVLAASVLPTQSLVLGEGATLGPAGCPAQAWAGLLLPASSLMAGRPGVGMVSTLPDADGQLRTWPLWHADGERVLPSLPLAAVLAARGADPALLKCSDGEARLGELRFPIDAQGRVRPAFHRRADGVPLRSYESVVQSALGVSGVGAEDLRGQVVVIGASAVLGDRAQTPLGPRWGPGVVAETLASLESGRLITPPQWRFDLLWLLLACLPALVAWRRGALRPGADLAWALGGGLVLAGSTSLVYALAGVQSRLVWPLLALGMFALMSLLQWRSAMLVSQLRLERERAAADAASRVKSEFLAHMSHEIRTPMNALLGSAELLAQTPLDERQRRHVALFQSAGASLVEILNDLLDLSKIEAGLLELHLQPFSLVELVASQKVMFEARAAQKGLTLQTEFDPDLPPVVRGDGPRLAQVLRNLLGNAVKFTHRGSVTLAVRRVPTSPNRLRFEVRDTGIGIAPQNQQEIFQAFTQADSGVARAYGGTGLGLTISNRLVSLMGGVLGVDSREGEGSVFYLEVELPQSQEAPLALWAPSHPEPMADLKPGLRLLLADDNPQNVQLVHAYLEGDGHHIDVVHDGAAAVARFRAHRYDAVLMDVQMPGMDGYRATAALRAIERERGDPPVPVIALTANAMPDDERRSLQAGCTAHLSKPFSRAQLKRALTRSQTGGRSVERPEVAAFAHAPWPLPALAAQAGFDLPAALARMDGQTGLYLRVVQGSIPLLRDWDARFAQSVNQGELAGALRLSHDLKSTAATLGATALAEAAASLEALLRAGAPPAVELQGAQENVRPPLTALLAVLDQPKP